MVQKGDRARTTEMGNWSLCERTRTHTHFIKDCQNRWTVRYVLSTQTLTRERRILLEFKGEPCIGGGTVALGGDTPQERGPCAKAVLMIHLIGSIDSGAIKRREQEHTPYDCYKINKVGCKPIKQVCDFQGAGVSQPW